MKIRPEDIRKVMERYGESLTDLGADYCREFEDWFKGCEPRIYQDWLESISEYVQKDSPDWPAYRAELLLFQFSNNSLGGRVYEQHDDYLAEFFNQSGAGNRHIIELLQGLE